MSDFIINGMSIRTSYWPVHTLRELDWLAMYTNREPGDPIGYGATEEEAIQNLLLEIKERAT